MVTSGMNLKEPDQSLLWLNAFEAQTGFEKKRDIKETLETSGPPAVAAVARDYYLTAYFMSQCGLEALIKPGSLVAHRNFDDMKFMDIRKDHKRHLKARRSRNRLSYQAPRGYALFQVVDLKAYPNPEAESIRLQFIVGLRDSQSKLKSLEAQIANNS